jgi:predicted aldo/keto reductase-like oxidoreductase
MPNSRRQFLKTALTLPLAFAAGSSLLHAAESAAPSTPAPSPGAVLPTRQLGKDGPQISMLCLGGMMGALSPEYLDIAWSMGIRCFDTADCYLKGQSEKIIGAWLAQYPERRKEIFLVTKDHPTQGPEQLLEQIDRRLAALGTTYVDAFYIHGISEKPYGGSLEWPKNDAYKKVIEELKKSGKCRKVGFSCHDDQVADYLNAAAQGGFVDVIMLKYSPFFTKGDAFDSAVDAAYKAGIGLIAMKTMRALGDVPKRIPEFDKLGLTTHEALLHAVWSDPRISSICSMINNVGEMDMNAGAARSFKKPLATAHVDALKEVVMAHRRSYCPGCPSCRAFGAASALALHDISRFVSYYELEGRLESRELYQALPQIARDASTVDLAALREACDFKTDYPEIVRRAERYFA